MSGKRERKRWRNSARDNPSLRLNRNPESMRKGMMKTTKEAIDFPQSEKQREMERAGDGRGNVDMQLKVYTYIHTYIHDSPA